MRDIELGKQIEGSALIPLKFKRKSRDGRRVYYECLCTKCGNLCVKAHVALSGEGLSKACAKCVIKVKRETFNRPFSMGGWKSRVEYENRESQQETGNSDLRSRSPGVR